VHNLESWVNYLLL